MLLCRAAIASCAITTIVLFAATTTLSAQEAGQWEITSAYRDGQRPTAVNITFSQGSNRNTTPGPMPLVLLSGLTAAQLEGNATDVRFRIMAPAGSVSLTGTVGHGHGSGDYTFAPNRAFSATLAAHGIRGGADDYNLFRLAIRDVTVGRVDTLIAALRQYGDVLPDAGDFVRLLNHDVTPRVVADLGGAGLRGLEPGQIIRLVNHDVDSHYVQALRAAGYTTDDADMIVHLHNRGVALRGDTDGAVKLKYRDRRSDS